MARLLDTELLEQQIFGDALEEAGEPYQPEDTDSVELELTLEDGSTMVCQVAGVFMEGERECIALEGEQDTLYIMELDRGPEDEILLLPLKDEEDQERALAAFFHIFGTEEEPEEEEKEGEGFDYDRD